MAAVIRRLKTKPEAALEEATDQLVLALEWVEPHRRGRVASLVRELRRELKLERARKAEGWPFVMINGDRFEAVYDWLEEHSARPRVATRLWVKLITRLDQTTGEILATRAELAEAARAAPKHVSEVMTELAEQEVILKRRERANGPVRYFLNPRVGTHLPKEIREPIQAKAPELKLVEPA